MVSIGLSNARVKAKTATPIIMHAPIPIATSFLFKNCALLVSLLRRPRFPATPAAVAAGTSNISCRLPHAGSVADRMFAELAIAPRRHPQEAHKRAPHRDDVAEPSASGTFLQA